MELETHTAFPYELTITFIFAFIYLFTGCVWTIWQET